MHEIVEFSSCIHTVKSHMFIFSSSYISCLILIHSLFCFLFAQKIVLKYVPLWQFNLQCDRMPCFWRHDLKPLLSMCILYDTEFGVCLYMLPINKLNFRNVYYSKSVASHLNKFTSYFWSNIFACNSSILLPSLFFND